MQPVPLAADWFQGAISVELCDGWLKPWRLPHDRRNLFPSPNEDLLSRAEMASGARLRFATDSTRLVLRFLPLPGAVNPVCPRDTFRIDLTLNGDLLVSADVKPGGEEAEFSGLPQGEKALELWLPQDTSIAIRDLRVDDGTACRQVPDPRPKWVTYGSSLTHCVRAHSPARIWPAIVARRRGLNLTCLGFGGQCCLDPMVALVIRDRPADLITLKLGINCIGGALNARTFPAAVIGLVQIIREKHPRTPIGLVSPIGYPPNETKPDAVGYTIRQMREAIQDAHRRMVQDGDTNLYCFNGLDVFSEELIARYTADQCHPNADGIEVMAENFDRAVMEPLVKKVV
ncbi:MAG: hypothetical protein A3K19_10600 [Lentisphaerae bacterium RIFOXYB12_FULL_65_16]|nr:MAG: hypothetical protein A3K18_05260 [Lentisphaerae bacterium RIFOXYA12_64_32]OGV87902.1 MAG: hypothetical protein A3K19_10600 [Lentisphaerae bacterium RIFOXYB12_FULL_65_16]